VPIRWLLVRDPRGELPPQAFLCTNLDAAPVDILQWFVSRWQLEVTFQEVRAHLGVETQRQWSDLAIMRTTPALLGLFSLVTLWAHDLAAEIPLVPATAAWYPKSHCTFSDAIAPRLRRGRLPCAARSGSTRFLSCPGATGTASKFPASCGTAPQTRWPMPRSSIKSS
jgi:hypothetical protein